MKFNPFSRRTFREEPLATGLRSTIAVQWPANPSKPPLPNTQLKKSHDGEAMKEHTPFFKTFSPLVSKCTLRAKTSPTNSKGIWETRHFLAHCTSSGTRETGSGHRSKDMPVSADTDSPANLDKGLVLGRAARGEQKAMPEEKEDQGTPECPLQARRLTAM